MIIGFAGRKRSGKDSSLKYVYGQLLKKNDIVDRFDIDNDGNLIVPAQFEDGVHMGVFDIANRDFGHVQYFMKDVWPYVKDYYFASYLKEMILRLFNIAPEQLSGTTEQRDSLVPYKWELFIKLLGKNKVPKGVKADEQLTARQFIQHYADVIRYIDDGSFTKVLMDEIDYEQVPVALVGDIRRKIEADAIRARGGKIIYLKRKVSDDAHNTETEFDNVDDSYFDAVIDNQDMDMATKNIEVHRIMSEWGVF